MTGRSLPAWNQRKQNRAVPPLAITVACAALLAGCDASLQNELSPAVSQQPTDGSAVAARESGNPVSVTTASTTETKSSRESKSIDTSNAAPAENAADESVKKTSFSKATNEGDGGAPSGSVQLPPSAREFTSISEPGNAAYRIGPLDVLAVSVFRVPELSATVQVADTGTINLPLIGEIPASGRTAQEVERDITARLGEKYLQNPQVTVFIKEYNARRVTVDGSVKKPGVYPLRGRTSLLQAITMAEGLDINRASGEVVVFRNSDGKRTAARFNLDEIRSGQAPDPIVEPGDVVIVDDSTAKVVLNNVLRVLPVTSVFMGVF